MFVFWAIHSSQSCFCWLYRTSPSLAAKNIINLISVLIIWWYPCVDSSLVLLEEGVCYDQWQNSFIFCPASFFTPWQNLPVTPGVYEFLLLHSNPLCFFSITGWGIDLGHSDVERFALETNRDILSFLRLHPSTAFWNFVGQGGCSISSKGFLPTVIDIMVIRVKFTHSSPF